MIQFLKNNWYKNKTVYIFDFIMIVILSIVMVHNIYFKKEMKVYKTKVEYIEMVNSTKTLRATIYKDDEDNIEILKRVEYTDKWNNISISLDELEEIVNAAKDFRKMNND